MAAEMEGGGGEGGGEEDEAADEIGRKEKGEGDGGKCSSCKWDGGRPIVTDRATLGDGDSHLGRKRYGRAQMEALRFSCLEEQQMRWSQVYLNFDDVLMREYDSLMRSDESKWPLPSKPKSNEKKKVKKKKKKKVSEEHALEIDTNDNRLDESCDKYDGTDYCNEVSDDEYESIMKPAFFVEGEPDFDSGPPQDGWEYLRRVRWEAAQIPNVTVAKLNSSQVIKEQTPYMPNVPEMPKCPRFLLPTKEWVHELLADFSNLRLTLSELDATDEALDPGNHSNNLGSIPDTKLLNNNTMLAIIRKMNLVSRATTLRNYIDSVESLPTLSRANCLWLFALCAAVDIPLHADTSASMRSLLRKCLAILAGKSDADVEAAMLICLVTICGKYFGQQGDVESTN